MPQTISDLFGPGATLVNGVLSVDFTDVARAAVDLVNTPASISATKAASVILKRFALLTAANDVSDAAIAAPTTTSTPSYVSSRGGTAVTQMRKSTTIYEFYTSTDTTADPDNLV